MEIIDATLIIFCKNKQERSIVHTWARENDLETLPWFHKPFENLEECSDGVWRIPGWISWLKSFIFAPNPRIVCEDYTNSVIVCDCEYVKNKERELSPFQIKLMGKINKYNIARSKKEYCPIEDLDEKMGEILERCEYFFDL